MTDYSGDASESATTSMLVDFGRRLREGDVHDLWLPTHLVHDGELDDTLAWLLLDKVYALLKPKTILGSTRLAALFGSSYYSVLFQLPTHKLFDSLQKTFASRCVVFRDEWSRNGRAVASNFSMELPADFEEQERQRRDRVASIEGGRPSRI